MTRCIDCGGAVDSLNEDEDGIPCPTCAERLLETLPGVFHAPWADVKAADQSEAEETVDDVDVSMESVDADTSPGFDGPFGHPPVA